MAGTSFLDQLFARQVYVKDASDRFLNIGYFTSSNVPCNGNIFIYADFVQEFHKGFYPPSTWYYKDEFGIVNKSVTQYCVNKGITPSWTKASGSGYVADSPTGPFTVNPKVQPGEPLSVVDLTQKTSALVDSVVRPAGLPTTALLIGGAILGLVLVMK